MLADLFEGTDLRRYLHSRGHVLDVDWAVSIAHDVALFLGAVHQQNIVHGNIKPQNILLGRQGSIKLTGFGSASAYKDITAVGMTLGIVLYEMLTGHTLFDGETPVAVAMQHIQDTPVPPREMNPGIPPGLEEIILRCLEKVPEKRFRDGSELADALSGFQEGAL